VLLNGQPLPGGRVTFRPADGRRNSVTSTISEKGEYQAVLPVGEVKVTVDNSELEPPAAGLAGLPKGLPLDPKIAKELGGGKGAEHSTKPPPAAPTKSPGKLAGR